MKWSKSKRRWFLAIGSTLAVLLLMPYIILQFYKKEIKQEIEKEIDKSLNASVTFHELDFSLFRHFPRLTVYMNDMDILGIDEFQGDTLACIQRVDLELDWFKLATENQLELRRVFFNDPSIYLIVLKNGHANYDIIKPDTLAAADTTDNSTISLNKFVIKRGVLKYQNLINNTVLEMHGINHVGSIDYSKEVGEYITDTEIEKFSLFDNGIQYIYNKQVTVDFKLEMNLKSHSFRFKENVFGINKFIFTINGQVDVLPSGYNLDLLFASKETSFSDILSLVPDKYLPEFKDISTEGLINFNGYVKGNYYDTSTVMPAFHVDINVMDAMFKMKNFDAKAKDIQFELMVENKSGIMDSTVFDLRKLNMDLGGYPVKGRCKLQGFDSIKIDTDISAEVELAQIEKIYPIKGFDIDGKLTFELKANGIYKQKQLNTTSVIERIPAFNLNLTLSDGQVKYDSAHAAFHGIELFVAAENKDGNPEHTSFDVKELEMYLGENHITGNMLLKGLTSYYIKSDLKANMNLADIERLYPLNNNIIKGMFTADINLDGYYDKEKNLFPAINAAVNLTNGYLKNPNYPEPIENIEIAARAVNTTGKAENTRIDFDQLNFLMEGNPFLVKGYIEDFVKMNYDVTIKGLLDLEKLTKIFPIEGVTLLGTVDADIESKGSIVDIENKNFSKITCLGNVVLEKIKYRAPSFRASLHLNQAFLKLTPEKIVMTKCDGRVGRTNFSVTGDLMNYMYFLTSNNDMITGDLKLISDTLDLTPWIDKTYVGRRKRVPTVDATPAAPTEQSIWEVPKNINFVFDSEIEHVFYQDLHITKLKGEITMKNGILTLDETGFNSMGASFSVQGDYNTTDMRHPMFDVSVVIKELDVNKAYKEIALVRKLAPAAGDTYGRVSVNYKLSGELTRKGDIKLETLKGGGNITIADAKINGMKMFDEISRSAKKQEMKNPELKNLSMNSEIHDNKIYIKPFSVKVNGLNTDIEGSNDITGGNLNYLIKIELIPIDKMKIPFHVTGTYDDPKVAMGKGKKES